MKLTKFIYEDIDQESASPFHLSFIPSLFRVLKETWDKPFSTTQMSRRIENLYKIHGPDADFLIKHPPPNSVVVDVTQTRSCTRSTAMPSNKEGC